MHSLPLQPPRVLWAGVDHGAMLTYCLILLACFLFSTIALLAWKYFDWQLSGLQQCLFVVTSEL